MLKHVIKRLNSPTVSFSSIHPPFTSSLASRSASDATTYSSSFLPVTLKRTCLVFQNFFCMRAITELSSSLARPLLSMSPANLEPGRRREQVSVAPPAQLSVLFCV